MLAKTYGWNIEYIMDLSYQQVDALMEGIEDTEDDKKNGNKNSQSVNNSGRKTVNGLSDMVGLPGFNLSKKARKKVQKLKREGKV